MQHELSKQRNALVLGIKALSLPFSEAQIDSIMLYGELLYQANNSLNLTRVPIERFVDDHILDSLAGADKFLSDSVEAVIDLGTGAGLPGIPIKIFYPGVKVVLVETREKKVGFLEQAIRKLNLSNIEALAIRAEELAHNPDYREKFDICCSRALAEMRVFLELAAGFIKTGGVAATLKTDSAQDEARASEEIADTLGFGKIKNLPYAVPGAEIPREVFVWEKIKSTEKKFPRPIKKIKNSQLV